MRISEFICITMSAALLTAAVSCSSEIQPKPTIAADSSTVNADGTDYIRFTVLSGTADVTAESSVYAIIGNTLLEDKTFSTTEPGYYSFYAEYGGMFSDTITIEALCGIDLISSQTAVIYNGDNTVSFTVMQGDNDITAQSTLYSIAEDGSETVLEGNSYVVSTEGIHNFVAANGTFRSDTVSVWGMSDPQPENTDFTEKTLVIEFTGTWCGYCGIMKAALRQLEEDGYSGLSAEVHGNDILEYPLVYDMCQSFAISGFPGINFNMDIKHLISGSYNTIDENATKIDNTVNSALSEYPCTAGISASYSALPDGTLKVHADVKLTDDGEYRIAAWLLEDGIYEPQANNIPEVDTEEVSTHYNVLRAASTGEEDFTGEDIVTGDNGYASFEWTFNQSQLYNGNPESSHVLVFVCKKQDKTYIVNNVINCEYGSETSFCYAE